MLSEIIVFIQKTSKIFNDNDFRLLLLCLFIEVIKGKYKFKDREVNFDMLVKDDNLRAEILNEILNKIKNSIDVYIK
ncbi:MAG: hypothetical protein ACO2O4_00705 [Minisyncoccia bacterium]|jgi:hypothetical protein